MIATGVAQAVSGDGRELTGLRPETAPPGDDDGWPPAARQLLVENERLALVARLTSSAVIVTDAAGRIEWVNEAFTRISGRRRDEAAGRKPGELLQGPGTDPATVAYLRDCVARGRSFRCDLLNYHTSGRSYWITLDGHPVHDETGRLAGFTAVQTDITERRNLEQVLRFSQQRSRSLIDTLPGAVCEFYVTAAGRFGCTFASAGIAAICGLAADRIMAAPEEFGRLIEPAARAAGLASLKAAAAAGTLWDHTLRLRRAGDGCWRWLRIRAQPHPAADGAVRWTGMLFDTTELKQAELELAEQLGELRRWHGVTLGRERRIADLKREVNALLIDRGQPPRYDDPVGSPTALPP